jgi:hypothetical protein
MRRIRVLACRYCEKLVKPDVQHLCPSGGANVVPPKNPQGDDPNFLLYYMGEDVSTRAYNIDAHELKTPSAGAKSHRNRGYLDDWTNLYFY